MARQPEHYVRARIICALGLLVLVGFLVISQPPNWLFATTLLVGAMCALLGVKLGFINASLLDRFFKLG